MRLIVGGGRAAETLEAKGAVVLGVRTLSEGGRVGNFSREQVIHFYRVVDIYVQYSLSLCDLVFVSSLYNLFK